MGHFEDPDLYVHMMCRVVSNFFWLASQTSHRRYWMRLEHTSALPAWRILTNATRCKRNIQEAAELWICNLFARGDPYKTFGGALALVGPKHAQTFLKLSKLRLPVAQVRTIISEAPIDHFQSPAPGDWFRYGLRAQRSHIGGRGRMGISPVDGTWAVFESPGGWYYSIYIYTYIYIHIYVYNIWYIYI